MKNIIIIIMFMFIGINSYSQSTILLEQSVGKRGVITLSGFSLSTISYTVNPETNIKPYKDVTRIIPFYFGVTLMIGGILPDKKGRFYKRMEIKTN